MGALEAAAARLVSEGHLGPFNGECALCGAGSDQRHRLADAIVERVAAGDLAREVWGEYPWLGVMPYWLEEFTEIGEEG